MHTPIKVISLARSLDRRARFAGLNDHLAFEFVDAADGAAMLPDIGQATDLFAPGLRYSAGAYGCALSHLLLWQEAAASGQPLTIVEDDAILRHDFAAQSAAALARLPADWDLVVWAWNFDSILALNLMPQVSPAVMLFDQGSMRDSIAAFQAIGDVPMLARLDKCFGTPAYTISPAGARKFMAGCFPLEPFELYFPVLNRKLPNNGIDIAMNRIYGSTNSYCALAPLAVTKNEHAGSLIQERK